MRTTLALDDELVAKAQAFTGLKEKSALVREALKALIAREAARRLATLRSGLTICADATKYSRACWRKEAY
jgi:Arc/MetJ family transcription regulator